MPIPLNIPESFSITENLKFEYRWEDRHRTADNVVSIYVRVPMFHGAGGPNETNTVMLVTVAQWSNLRAEEGLIEDHPTFKLAMALKQMMDRISHVCYCIQSQYCGFVPGMTLEQYHSSNRIFESHCAHASSIRQQAKQALGVDFSDRRDELIDAIISEVSAITEAA